jgi:hypothetical protein
MSQAFDALPVGAAAGVAAAVGFAEVAGTAVGSLLGGGLYSLGESVDIAAGPSMSAALALLTGAAALAWRRSAVA